MPLADENVYAVAKVSGTIDFYKTYKNEETNEYEQVKIATLDKGGKLEITEKYKDEMKKKYQDFAKEIKAVDKDDLQDNLSDQEKMDEVLTKENLEEEKKFISKETAAKEMQEAKKEEEKKDIEDSEKENSEDKENKEELKTEEPNQDIAKIAKKKGLSAKDIKASAKINPRELIATGITFESAMGISGQYSDIYATEINGTYAFFGIDKQTGEPEKILEKSGTSQGERDVPLMNENGTNIEKKQTRAIMKVDSDQAFALNIEPGGRMNVYYCARGNDSDEYFGIPISTDKQSRSTGKTERFMGVEVMGNKGNRYEVIDEAYEQLEETTETNQTLIDTNEENDVIYYDVDEPIEMHDGSITTIAQEAEKSEEYKDNLSGYLFELEHSDGKCLSDKIVSMREKVSEIEQEENEQPQDETDNMEERKDRSEELEEARMEALRRAQFYENYNNNGG